MQNSNVIDQISTLATSLAAVIAAVSGIITYAITNFRKVKKEDLTERDKWIMESLKGVQMISQKSAETIGSNKQIIDALYKANLTEDQRKKIEATVTPILQQTDARLRAANEQAAMVKALTVRIFGQVGDVDQDPTIPREEKGISTSLRSA